MELKITFIPAEFHPTGKGYTFAIPYTAIKSGVYNPRNITELESLVLTLAATVHENAIISLRPQGRKMNGFDKWEKSVEWSTLQVRV